MLELLILWTARRSLSVLPVPPSPSPYPFPKLLCGHFEEVIFLLVIEFVLEDVLLVDVASVCVVLVLPVKFVRVVVDVFENAVVLVVLAELVVLEELLEVEVFVDEGLTKAAAVDDDDSSVPSASAPAEVPVGSSVDVSVAPVDSSDQLVLDAASSLCAASPSPLLPQLLTTSSPTPTPPQPLPSVVPLPLAPPPPVVGVASPSTPFVPFVVHVLDLLAVASPVCVDVFVLLVVVVANPTCPPVSSQPHSAAVPSVAQISRAPQCSQRHPLSSDRT